ncbi:hypothetical protein [Halorussus salinisoli]|uniref:hypothetical protein n=1 Tax=Halorussus salinisoli TaxID=2558242 RepID=UPI0010C1C30C|nr:hypothetical protein [Halorussus salinisoli]
MTSNEVERNGLLHDATIYLAFALAAIHFLIGLFVERPGSPTSIQFLLVGAVFLAGVGVHFTPYFRPILYLLGSLFAGFLGVLWLLGGMQYVGLGVLTGVVGGSFILLTTYLFVRAEAAGAE